MVYRWKGQGVELRFPNQTKPQPSHHIYPRWNRTTASALDFHSIKDSRRLDLVVHTCRPSTKEAEAKGSKRLRAAFSLPLFSNIDWVIKNGSRDCSCLHQYMFRKALLAGMIVPYLTSPWFSSVLDSSCPYLVKLIPGWPTKAYHRCLISGSNAYFCHTADLTWFGGRQPSGKTPVPCVSSFILPTMFVFLRDLMIWRL